jgi:hypothetical protein
MRRTAVHTRFFNIGVNVAGGGYGVDVGAEKEEEGEDVDDFEQDAIGPGTVRVGHCGEESTVVVVDDGEGMSS